MTIVKVVVRMVPAVVLDMAAMPPLMTAWAMTTTTAMLARTAVTVMNWRTEPAMHTIPWWLQAMLVRLLDSGAPGVMQPGSSRGVTSAL